MMRKLTTEEFIEKARAVHGDKYDYSVSIYVSAHTKISLICKSHGKFLQTPNSHLSGCGCPVCAKKQRPISNLMGVNEFVMESRKIHGDRYDYSEVKYKKSIDKVKIRCMLHGHFYQSPNNHLAGHGCPECSRNKKRNSLEFIKKAHEVHGADKYIYSLVDYKNANTKVLIICNNHGVFEQTPIKHTLGGGCPSCAKYGFDESKVGFVYFLISEFGIKVGISNNPSQRLQKLKSATPFDFHFIAEVKTTGAEAMRKEKYYHHKYESASLTGFDGATEWLRFCPELMSEIMNEKN